MYFPFILFLLTCSLISMWSENQHCMILFYFFQFVKVSLWPKMWSILVNASREIQKNVYLTVVRCSSIQMSIKCSWLMVLLNSVYVLTKFFLLDVSIYDRRVLNFPTMIVSPSIFSILFVLGLMLLMLC